eukprot:4018014-Prymnesium_polylepis.1
MRKELQPLARGGACCEYAKVGPMDPGSGACDPSTENPAESRPASGRALHLQTAVFRVSFAPSRTRATYTMSHSAPLTDTSGPVSLA